MRQSRSPVKKLLSRIGRVIVATVACLLLVLVVRTVRFESRQIQVPPAEPIELPEQAIVNRFARALSIKTVSDSNPARIDAEAFDQFKLFLEESFPLVHQHLTRMTGVDFGDERNQSLLFKWQGSEPGQENESGPHDAILLMAHYDVVPVELAGLEDWIHPPFGGEMDDQYVWGRGAIDNKGAAMGLMEAVEYLLSQGFKPEQTIYLSLGHDEEVGGRHGNKPISNWMRQQGVRLDYVLDEGGGIFNDFPGLTQPAAIIGIGEKGYVTFKLSAEVSEAGHSSMPPPLNKTAIGILGEAVRKLRDAPFPARLDGGLNQTLDYLGSEMPLINRVAIANRWLFSPLLTRQLSGTPFGNAALRTTIAPTMVEGGIKDNVLPSRASMMVNVRVLPKDSIEGAREHIEDTVGDLVTVEPEDLQKEPSRLSPTDSTAFNELHRTIREIYPKVVVAPFVVVAGTDASHYGGDQPLTDNIYHFVPWQLGKDDLKQIHGANERLSRADYVDLVRFYERLIRNTATSSPAP